MNDPIGNPVLVNQCEGKASCTSLARVPLMRAVEGVNEDWLQEVLHSAPDLLPIATIDDRPATPLVSLGREVGTPVGPIDNLFIAQNGQLVVVEAKLWRNPESRREVVSQILDYATQLRQWTYEALEKAWRQACTTTGSLYEFVGPAEYDETEWFDVVNRNLDRGRMTLVIVGDGIRSEARQLAETVNRHPDFEFRLAMVELRLFQFSETERIAIPVTLLRTEEIIRAVVRVEKPVGLNVAVTVETPASPDGKRQPASILSETAFLEELGRRSERAEKDVAVAKGLLRALGDSSLIAEWKTASLGIRTVSQAGRDKMISLLFLVSAGTLTDSGLLRQEIDPVLGPDNAVYRTYVDTLQRFGAVRKQGKYEVYYQLKLADLDGREEQFVEGLEEVMAVWQKAAGLEST